MLNNYEEPTLASGIKESSQVKHQVGQPIIFGDPFKMSIADKREYERWYNYAIKHYTGSLSKVDNPQFFEDWENRANLGLALLDCIPVQNEIAIEILSSLAESGCNNPNTQDTENEFDDIKELRVEVQYSLGMAVLKTLGDANQALEYLTRALSVAEQYTEAQFQRARGEVFYGRLLILKDLGCVEEAFKDISEKVALYDRQDDRANSYLFFASLFKADLAKEQGDLEQAITELQNASCHYPFCYPQYQRIKEVLVVQADDPESAFQEIREMMEDFCYLEWENDGPYATPLKEGSDLYKAIERRDENEALRLIELGGLDKAEDLLYQAVSLQEIGVVEALLKAGFNPNQEDSSRGEVLWLVLNNDQPVELLDKLLQAGLYPDGENKWCVPLNRAIKNGSQEKVELLIKAGVNVNREERFRETPILMAAGQLELLKLLIAAGADIHCQDLKGHTPLIRAAAAGSWEGMQLLWDAGADKSAESLETALNEAVKGDKESHFEVVSRLITMGVSVGSPGKVYLRGSAQSGNIPMLKLLIEAGAGVNDQFIGNFKKPVKLNWYSDLANREGVTALAVAAQEGQVEAIKLLLKCGAVVNLADDEGVTPLMYACYRGNEPAATLLIEAGADIYAIDKYGETPFSYALQKGSYLTLEVLEEVKKLRPQVTVSSTPDYTEHETDGMHVEQLFKGLVGLQTVKKEFAKLIRTIKNIQLKNQTYGLGDQSNYNLMIEGEAGSGKYTLAQIYMNILVHYGIIKKQTILRIDKDQLDNYRGIEDKLRNHKGGVVYLDGIDVILPGGGGNKRNSDHAQLDRLLHELARCQNDCVFIIAGQLACRVILTKYTPIEKLSHFAITIPDYSLRDMTSFAQAYAAKAGYQLSKSASSALKTGINSYQTAHKFGNFSTVKLMIDKAIVTHAGHSDYTALAENERIKLCKVDFDISVGQVIRCKESKNSKESEVDPFAELEALIGLSEVKERVKEIAAYIALQKRRNEVVGSTAPLCLHMAFTGNPGTGKTTVAHIIGKIFKKLNVFAKGHFVETSRVDLVGQYIGHTAAKTTNTIKTAMDGVLFIDEAYSLFVDSGRDFGREAVATLIKEMEDQRGHLAVIFAGYSVEMEQFISMNPGLRDRIQFRIDFPDFTGAELLAIFEKLCQEEQLSLEIAAREGLIAFFESMSDNKGKDFANGRLVRKCFERVKLAQAKRLSRTEIVVKEDLVTIVIEDVQALYSDLEITQLLKSQSKQIKIGFGI